MMGGFEAALERRDLCLKPQVEAGAFLLTERRVCGPGVL